MEEIDKFKKDSPEMLKELGRAVRYLLNRHEGQGSDEKCCEEEAESGSLREYSILPGNTYFALRLHSRSV